MDADQITRIALTVFTPILTAAIGIVALVIGDWRERRSQAGRRKLAFEDASRQVAFATEWWNASKLIASSADDQERASARAQAWLEEATTLVAESEPPPVEDKQAITLRRLLIAFPMERRAARTLRAFFYFFLGLVVFQVSSTLSSAFGRPDTLGIPNYFSEGLIYGDLIALCVMMLIAMAFRFLSLYVEKSGPAPETQGRTDAAARSTAVPIQPARGQDRAHRLLAVDPFCVLSPIGMVDGRLRRPALDPR